MEGNNKGEHHTPTHTYESDLALSMDATDAKVVQELLETARERELIEQETYILGRQKIWFRAGGIILILVAFGALAYGIYHYKRLTVEAEPTISVGVFQNIEPVVITTTPLTATIFGVLDNERLPTNKPLLVPLVYDAQSLLPISNEQFATYIGAHASEPFLASISLMRLGVFNSENTVSIFIIFSVPNSEIASKEFLIAEPDLLTMFGEVLNIDLSNQTVEIGKSFTSSYMYNLPVRSLKSVDIDTKAETIMLYYAYVTDHTIVLATNPTILKAVYDMIIKQH